MEEDKTIKRRKLLKMVSKIISYTFIVLLMIVASFLILYVICGKVAEKKGEKPLFGLYTVISPSMTPNINVYDVIFVKKIAKEDLKVGDVITFYSTNPFFGGTPVTHRIVEILDVPESGMMFRVKGDANEVADEEKVLPNNIVGKVLFRLPGLGKAQYFLASKSGWLLAILLPALAIVAYDIFKIFRLFLLKSKLESISNENSSQIEELEENKKSDILANQLNQEIIEIIDDKEEN